MSLATVEYIETTGTDINTVRTDTELNKAESEAVWTKFTSREVFSWKCNKVYGVQQVFTMISRV
jgi:hypothetical protein